MEYKDERFQKLMRKFCDAAYMTEYKQNNEKKEALQKTLKPVKKYQYLYARNLFGEKNLEKEYKYIYKEMQEDRKELPYEKRKMLDHIDTCVEAGDSFYVST